MLLLFPDINNEYELYNLLVCRPEKNQRFRNYQCILKLCQKCSNWEDKIRSLVPIDQDYSKIYSFRNWESTTEKNKAGKNVVRRSLQRDSGTANKVLDKLIDAVLKPGRGFTFVEHFFRQRYQQQMYKNCLDSLKYGEAIFIQDFSKNKTLEQQFEIKGNY